MQAHTYLEKCKIMNVAKSRGRGMKRKIELVSATLRINQSHNAVSCKMRVGERRRWIGGGDRR